MNLQLISLLNDRSLDPLNFLLLHLRQIVHFVLQQLIAIAQVAHLLYVAIEGTNLSVISELTEVCLVCREKVALKRHVYEDNILWLYMIYDSE